MTRKLVWSEGLVVTQHHLQQQDRYFERLLARRLRSVSPFDWGVIDIVLDEQTLTANRVVEVDKLVAVMPDGTWVECEAGTPSEIAPRPIDDDFPNHLQALDVHVALPIDNDGRGSVDLDGEARQVARWARVFDRVPDVNVGGLDQELARAVPIVRILLGEEVVGSFESLRVGQIVRDAQGGLVWKNDVLPPMLRTGASATFQAQLEGLLGGMISRQQQLAESRRQRSEGSVEFDARDTMRFWLLDLLDATIPVLRHYLSGGNRHPEEIYVVLIEFLGRLSNFAEAINPASLPAYDHADPGASVGAVIRHCLELLGTVLVERYLTVALKRGEDGVYLGKIGSAELHRHDFFLAVTSTPELQQQIRQHLPRVMKIASATQVRQILKSAICGAPIELEYYPSNALPIRPGVHFFKIGKPQDFWGDMLTSGTIGLYHPYDPRSVEIAVYGIPVRSG